MSLVHLATLAEMDEEISRRTFLRRLFAIGAGFVAGGALLRALDRFSPPLSGHAQIVMLEQWDALLNEQYVRRAIVEAYNVVTPYPNNVVTPYPRLPESARSRYYQVRVIG